MRPLETDHIISRFYFRLSPSSAYDKSMTMDYQVPIQFHHAYVNKILPGAEEIGYWTSFVTGKQPG